MAIIKNGVIYDVETVIEKVQSDWNQENPDALDFIRNKPDDITSLSNDITVSGVSVGNMTPGQTFNAGEDLYSILTKIFVKKVGCKKVPGTPALSLTSSPAFKSKYEVGEIIPDTILTSSISTSNQGSYESADSNVYTLTGGWDESTQTEVAAVNGVLNAKCSITGGPNYSITWGSASPTLEDNIIKEFGVNENINFTIKSLCVSSSTIVPYANDGSKDIDVKFNNYLLEQTLSVTGYYKYFQFYGDTATETVDEAKLRTLGATSGSWGWCNINKDTVVIGSEPTDNVKSPKAYYYLVLPQAHNVVKTISNGMGQSPASVSDWVKLQGTVNYTPSNESTIITSYYIYYYNVGVNTEFRNVSFGR